MIVFLQGVFFCVIGASVFYLCVRALFGKDEKFTERVISSAPEGALDFLLIEIPDASGSNLSVRVHAQSVRSNHVRSSGEV
jgi:hypothetical protein